MLHPLADLSPGLAPLLAANVDVGGAFGSCCLLVVLPMLQILVCWHVINCFQTLPPKHHFLEPNMAWLLMVPFFNLYWNFKVYPALAESFQIYFYSHGIADVEDCGEKLARGYCVCACLTMIPCLLGFPGIIALVCIIKFLIRTDALKNRVLAMESAAVRPS